MRRAKSKKGALTIDVRASDFGYRQEFLKALGFDLDEKQSEWFLKTEFENLESVAWMGYDFGNRNPDTVAARAYVETSMAIHFYVKDGNPPSVAECRTRLTQITELASQLREAAGGNDWIWYLMERHGINTGAMEHGLNGFMEDVRNLLADLPEKTKRGRPPDLAKERLEWNLRQIFAAYYNGKDEPRKTRGAFVYASDRENAEDEFIKLGLSAARLAETSDG